MQSGFELTVPHPRVIQYKEKQKPLKVSNSLFEGRTSAGPSLYLFVFYNIF